MRALRVLVGIITLAASGVLGTSGCERQPPTRGAAAPVRIDVAPATLDLPGLVRERATAEERGGRRLLVYVGATWCAPCRDFHAAATRGDLDRALPGLTFLEFDLDRDRDRLAEAGYASRLVPMFALPAADGRASGRYTEGVRKGAGAVADLSPRVQRLLE